MRTGWGGPRKGAGRKPGKRAVVHHVRRERFRALTPAMITVRVRDDVPSLRARRHVAQLQQSLSQACEQGRFRLLHYSIQRDHLHLIVEASDQKALGNGMKSLGARIARSVNRFFGRQGPVLAGRYHVRRLESPRQVRNALRYVLLNVRKHWTKRHGAPPPARIDPASSGRWFDGWRGRRGPPDPELRVARPKSWLVCEGWRRRGLLDPSEVPPVWQGSKRTGTA